MRCNTVKGLSSYSCSCDKGFTLQPDNKTCSGGSTYDVSLSRITLDIFDDP